MWAARSWNDLALVKRYGECGWDPRWTSQAAYALIDGLFENAPLGLIAGAPRLPRASRSTRWLMSRIVGALSPAPFGMLVRMSFAVPAS